MTDNPYRSLPAVDDLADEITSDLPRPLIVSCVRMAIHEARGEIAAGGTPDASAVALRLVRSMERSAGVDVINATGVLLHTNLGRAVWSKDAVRRAATTAGSFSNVEIDIETGKRSQRGAYVTGLLTELTGAESALVVNNNAAALLLALAATSKERAVPVSRGELIEIGGSYRLPSVMETSGAKLIEVGTTNRTRVGDYQTVLQTHVCGAILKVHPSNYRLEGFTEEADLEELSTLADRDTPLLYDLGSGLLDSEAPWVPDWLRTEPGVKQSLRRGADIVMFSGDKLLGGPQSGIIVGREDIIGRLRSNPLTRALRVDGGSYAALAATLEAFFDEEPTSIPFWRHALKGPAELAVRCDTLAQRVGGAVEDGSSVVGAGSAPGITIPSPVVRLVGEDDMFSCLLDRDRPVLARREKGDLLLDLRAVEPDDDETIAQQILACR